MKIGIVNGPNLNLLGKREPGIYGDLSFEEFLPLLEKKFRDCGISYFQSNIEGELIGKLQELDTKADGIILNAGGYSHTSVALADTISAISTKVIEVHISNVFAREDFRHVSLTGAKCIGSISGLGLKGYELAIQFLLDSGKNIK
jgi:3-dehydroquinate dehydratase II